MLHVDGKLDCPAESATIAGDKLLSVAAGLSITFQNPHAGRLDFSDESAIIVGITLLELAAGREIYQALKRTGRHFF